MTRRPFESGVWLLLALFMLPLAARVASAADPSDPGLYMSVSGSYGLPRFDTGESDFEGSLGLQAVAGIRAKHWLGFELDGSWLPNFAQKGGSGRIDAWTTAANARWFITPGRIQPSAVFGVGAIGVETRLPNTATTNEVGFMLQFGGALDLYVTERLAIVGGARFVLPTFNATENRHVAFDWGLKWRF